MKFWKYMAEVISATLILLVCLFLLLNTLIWTMEQF